MLLMLEQTGLFADLKPQEGSASWSKPRLFGKSGVLGSRFCPTSLQRGCCRAPLVSPGQVIPSGLFLVPVSLAECDRGQSAQLSSFHPALHNLSALWALQVLCICFLGRAIGELSWLRPMVCPMVLAQNKNSIVSLFCCLENSDQNLQPL